MHAGVCENTDLIKATTHEFKIYFLPNTIVKKVPSFPALPSNLLTPIYEILYDRVETDVLAGNFLFSFLYDFKKI